MEEQLVKLVREQIEALGVSYQETRPNNRMNCQVSFKISPRRTFCYVQLENRINPNQRFNLVFRIKKGDTPRDWHNLDTQSAFFRSFVNRMSLVWSQGRGNPTNVIDRATQTDQYGLIIAENDLSHPAFRETLSYLIRSAHAAVSRNWEEYELLTTSLQTNRNG